MIEFIKVALFILLFSILNNWNISLHFVAQTRKTKSERFIAFLLCVLVGILVGGLIFVP